MKLNFMYRNQNAKQNYKNMVKLYLVHQNDSNKWERYS
jgi:hypothetical protein